MANLVEFSEIRIQVSISYTLENNQEDEKLLGAVESVNGFTAMSNQMYCCGYIPYGFLIFEGETIPTEKEKKLMEKAVRRAIKQINRKH